MVEGVRAVCLRLWLEGRIEGVLCLGGAEGALLGAAAMHALPRRRAEGDRLAERVRAPRVRRRSSARATSLVMHSVVDILGLNPIARAVFDNAAAAVVGMARDAGGPLRDARRTHASAITMLGQTTPGGDAHPAALERPGYEPVIFHANGVGGPAMEKLIEDGALARRDRLHALGARQRAASDGLHATGPGPPARGRGARAPAGRRPRLRRLLQPGRAGDVPERYPRAARATTTTRLRRSSGSRQDEMAELGRTIAERLNEARGPGRVVAPPRGFSLADVEGGDLWDPEADAAFVEALSSSLGDGIAARARRHARQRPRVRRPRRRELPRPRLDARLSSS